MLNPDFGGFLEGRFSSKIGVFGVTFLVYFWDAAFEASGINFGSFFDAF